MPHVDSLPTEPQQRPAPRSPLQAVADAAARHYKEQFGRGPVRCRAHFAGRDTVVVVLDGTMSPAETRLVAAGEEERVRSFRTLLQHAVQDDLRAAVETLVGRRIEHAITGIDVQRDVVSELFTLQAEDADAA